MSKILKFRLEGSTDDPNVLSHEINFEGTHEECVEEIERLRKEASKKFSVTDWIDGFICQDASGRADIGYDIFS